MEGERFYYIIISLHQFSAYLRLLPVTSRVVCPVPARWHLPCWGCDMIGRSSLWPSRKCEDVLPASSSHFGNCCKNSPGICWLIHSCQMAKQHQVPFLNNRGKRWPISYLPHFSASILLASVFDRAQHSYSYSIIGKMQVLYRCSLVLSASRDFQMQLL